MSDLTNLKAHELGTLYRALRTYQAVAELDRPIEGLPVKFARAEKDDTLRLAAQIKEVLTRSSATPEQRINYD